MNQVRLYERWTSQPDCPRLNLELERRIVPVGSTLVGNLA
jgi:hypothetical protein